MSDGDFFEFSIAHDRRYSLDHLWIQVLDEKKEEDMTVKIGLSEFIRADCGDIIRVVLANRKMIANLLGLIVVILSE